MLQIKQLKGRIFNQKLKRKTFSPEELSKFVPDDVATPNDLEDICMARAEYANSETINHNAINWD